jgi:hypothetical protein
MWFGIYMAASHNHAEWVAHAHILLLGFMLSLAEGIIHRLWLDEPNHTVATIQFILHHVGALTLLVGLSFYMEVWHRWRSLSPSWRHPRSR